MTRAVDDADVVIVGSGFGGAVAARRLAGRDRSVVVLERGRRWGQPDLPRRPADFLFSSTVPHRLNGWLDLRFLDQMVVACGAGVGGGSLVYANVCVNAHARTFENGWPSRITYDELLPHYEAVDAMLAPKVVPPQQRNPRMHLLREAADAIGAGHLYTDLPLAVTFDEHATDVVPGRPWRNPAAYAPGTCTHCGDCVAGCRTGAKKTLDRNYLAEAEENGAEIVPLSMVTHVSTAPDGRWRVHYLHLADGRQLRREIVCRFVILAAGSIGSTEILMRSRDEFRTLPNLPRALGRGWSPNGDFLTLARYPGRDLLPTKGPTIGAAIDFLNGVEDPDDTLNDLDGQLFIEDGGLPNIIGAALADWKDVGGWKQRCYEKADQFADFATLMPWFGQSIDGADGEFSLRPRYRVWRGRLRLDWNPQRSKRALDTFGHVHVAMTRRTGGVPMPLMTWKRLRWLVTPHPLGGCNMASAPGVGVVDHSGEVFGHQNLFVMDGAVIPRAIGRNPSKTIAAIAERNCGLLAIRVDESVRGRRVAADQPEGRRADTPTDPDRTSRHPL